MVFGSVILFEGAPFSFLVGFKGRPKGNPRFRGVPPKNDTAKATQLSSFVLWIGWGWRCGAGLDTRGSANWGEPEQHLALGVEDAWKVQLKYPSPPLPFWYRGSLKFIDLGVKSKMEEMELQGSPPSPNSMKGVGICWSHLSH